MASQAEETAAALTAAYIARQRLLALTLTRDLILLVRQLFVPGRPGPSWATTKVQLDTLIRERRRLGADLAARYYVDLRGVTLRPALAADLRPEATREPAVERPAAREVLDSLDREAEPSPALAAEIEDDLGLDSISEEDAWAELERIAPGRPDDLDEDRVEANLDATGIGTYQKALRAGQSPDRAVDTMAVNLAGSATTLALEGGREVIRDATRSDEEAIGWIRVTDADPCSWCAMLASRAAAPQGTLYRSAGTAGRDKNAKFTGDGEFKWHDHCGCSAVPVFSHDDPLLEHAEDLYDQWLRETQGHSGKKAINAWRRYWENRDQEPDEGPEDG